MYYRGGRMPGVGIGMGLSLIGGLFGYKKQKEPEATKNPAFYNAPSDFDYYAYRYRVTGQVPVEAHQHLFMTAAPVVNVTVNMDGVKQAVKTEIESRTSSRRVALVNTHDDMHTLI